MITPADAAEILTIAQSLDGRDTPTRAMATAWSGALTYAGVEADEAQAAVIMYYADPANGRRRITTTAIIALVQGIRAERWRADERQRRDTERRELEAAGYIRPESDLPPLRDRREDLRKLLESFRRRPDGTDRWDPVGDPTMRRRQADSVNPEARAAAEEASRAKARAIVAESRARQHLQLADPEPEL
jgi:hypothetical protein